MKKFLEKNMYRSKLLPYYSLDPEDGVFCEYQELQYFAKHFLKVISVEIIYPKFISLVPEKKKYIEIRGFAFF